MNSEETTVTPEAPKGISRRTLVKGAAWSVPAIAVAAAAPAYAASVCPGTIPSVGAWDATLTQGRISPPSYSAGTVRVTDTLSQPTGPGTGLYTSHFENFYYVGQANAVSALVDVTGSYEVQAGQTYTITQWVNVRFPGDNINPDGADTYLDISIDGVSLVKAAARGTGTRTLINTNSNGDKTFKWTWTAATTGTVEYKFHYTLGVDQSKRGEITTKALGNPTIAIKSPIISC